MKRYIPYFLLVALSLQVATPLLADGPVALNQSKPSWGEWLKQSFSFDSWFNENLTDAINIGMTAGPRYIAPQLAEKNITNFAYKFILRLFGINNSNHANLVSWFLGQGKGGFHFYNRFGTVSKNWLPLFLIKIVGPAFIKRAVTGLLYKSVANGLGLKFPDWVKCWSFLHYFLAMNLQSFAHMGLDMAYHKGLEMGQNYL